MEASRPAGSRASKAERLFVRSVLPVLRELAGAIARTENMTVSIYLDQERVVFEHGDTVGSRPCQEEDARTLPLKCLVESPAVSSHAERVELFVARGSDPPKGMVQECSAGHSVYRNTVWVPMLGVVTVVGCGGQKLVPRGGGVELLRQLVKVTLDLSHVSVEWQYLSEALVHELTLTLMACVSSAERLQKLGRVEAGALTPEVIVEMRQLAGHIGDEAHMGLYEFDNVLRYLGSASSAAGEWSVGLAAIRRPHRHPVNLEWELRASVQRFMNRAHEKDLDLKYDVHLEQPAIVMADAYEIRRAFYNVLSNAVKYSYHSLPAGDSRTGARRFVWIFAADPDSADGMTLALCFENYGVGLVGEERKLIMLPGYRGILAEREARAGSGIGLSEVTKIMTALGGKVSVQSRRTRLGA